MAKNLGRMSLEQRTIDGKTYGVPFAAGTGTFWSDHAPRTEGCIYIVVRDDGSIIGAGPDPSWNMIEGYDIWEVEGTDWKGAVFKTWDGEKIT